MNPKTPCIVLIQMAAGAAIAGYFIGLMGRHFWLLDLFAHFRMQYTVVLLLCGLASLLLGFPKLGALNLVASACLGATLWPFTIPAVTTDTPGLKIISYNVLTSNDRHAEVRDFLRAENADVVFLMETNNRWARELEPLSDLYPHRLESPREDNFGIVLLSKLPFARSEVLNFGAHPLPAADITVRKDSHGYRILGIHTLPPIRRAAAEDRNHHLLQAADMISNSSTPHRLLLGDFNLTAYSSWFSEVLRRSKLHNVSPGYAATWRSGNPLFAIPIDHVLISRTLQMRSRKIGPSFGSDHSAVVVEVGPAPE